MFLFISEDLFQEKFISLLTFFKLLKITFMRIYVIFFCVFLCFICCSDTKKNSEYAVIDIASSLGKYQRIYCSELFSSIELIPLETNEDCLLDIRAYPKITLNDSIILMHGNNMHQLYAFDRTGKFMNKIGNIGQGPNEYTTLAGGISLSTDKSIIYVSDMNKIIAYDYQGNYIQSFPLPNPDNLTLSNVSYLEDNLFVGQVHYNGNNRFKYCLFDQKGDTINTFPNHIFFNRNGSWLSTTDGGHFPARVDNRLYLKDFINDTIYELSNRALQPVFSFYFKNNSSNHEKLETFTPNNDFVVWKFLGMPNYFFYQIKIPASISVPKSRPVYNHMINQFIQEDHAIYGLYDIVHNLNTLLDTDNYYQKGIINDLNGGLSLIPRSYAGNGEVADVWNVMDMREILNKEYFDHQVIKDSKGHQELIKMLKNMKDDDNPVVVVVKLH